MKNIVRRKKRAVAFGDLKGGRTFVLIDMPRRGQYIKTTLEVRYITSTGLEGRMNAVAVKGRHSGILFDFKPDRKVTPV